MLEQSLENSLLVIKTSIDIFSTQKCDVTLVLSKYIKQMISKFILYSISMNEV